MNFRGSVIIRITVAGDNGWRFDNPSGSRLQSQVDCVSSVDGVNVASD